MDGSSAPTVLVQLHGGLGNQLFQAAAGLALADRMGARLMVDLARFRDRSLRGYALAPLPVGAQIWPGGGPGMIERLRARFDKARGGKGVRRPPGWRGKVHAEPHYHYDPAFEALSGDLSGDVLIAGFFQSARYFEGREALVRARFDASGAVSDHARACAALLAGEDSVAVHIRRGDYVNDPRAAAVHGALTEDYYLRALDHVRAQAPHARVFVFSDDPAFAASCAARWGGESMAGASALDDLWLMSLCRRHVIANSSFSWWSAFLDPRPDAMVIAPVQWFAPAMMAKTRVEDVYPPHWLRM